MCGWWKAVKVTGTCVHKPFQDWELKKVVHFYKVYSFHERARIGVVHRGIWWRVKEGVAFWLIVLLQGQPLSCKEGKLLLCTFESLFLSFLGRLLGRRFLVTNSCSKAGQLLNRQFMQMSEESTNYILIYSDKARLF